MASARHPGVSASTSRGPAGARLVRTFASRLVCGCHILIPCFEPADDGLSLEPGHRRDIALRRVGDDGESPRWEFTAAGLAGPVALLSEAVT